MKHDSLRLTVWFGESERVGGRLLSDSLLERCDAAGLEKVLLLRGSAGFGHKHRLQTEHLLTLSRDLPQALVAVDRSERIKPIAATVDAGLVTLERVRRFDVDDDAGELAGDARLTVYLGSDKRASRRPAYKEVVEHLRSCHVAGAVVLLGVDGIAHGKRRRGRFFSRNADAPLALDSVGTAESIARALPGLAALHERPGLSLERIEVLKQDGVLIAVPTTTSATDTAGLNVWQKLTVYAGAHAQHANRPLHLELIRRLRLEGAAGGVVLPGIWGYSGDHEPQGDRLMSVRRRVPVVTSIIDQPDAIQRWWRIVDELTDREGLVTSELVPALRAPGPDLAVGGLRLAKTQSGD